MPASITTVLQLDDKDLKSKLESVSKYYNETYKNWANSTEKVNQKSKELISQKEKLAASVSKLNEEVKKGISANDNTISRLEKIIAGRKENIKVINAEKSALAASATLQRAELAQNKSGIDYLQKQVSAKKEATSATDNHAKSTENLANTTIRYLRWAGTIAGVVYAGKRAWDATLGTGIAVNKMMEDNQSGIAALLSANTQMVTSNGTVVNSYEKFSIGQSVAIKAMEELRVASIKTYATFPQLTEIFQQAIGHTMSMGDSFGTTTESIISNTVELSKRMSNIAGSIGMPMDRVKEEIRSILSANASTDSLIATMLFGSPGEANKAIKEAKTKGANGVKDMLNTMLAPFDALEGVQSFTRATLELQDAWSQTMMKLVKDSGLFNDLKVTFYDLAKTISANQKEITDGFNSFYEKSKQVASILDDLAIAVAAYYGTKGIIGAYGKASDALETLIGFSSVYDIGTKKATASVGTLAQNMKFLAAANPFTAWTIGIAAVIAGVYELQRISEKKSGERFTAGIKGSIASTSGALTTESASPDVSKAIASYEAQATAKAKILATADKEPELYRRTLESVTAINDELIRLNKIQDGTATTQENLTKSAESWGNLLTKVPINAALAEKIIKENNKANEETINIRKEIDEVNQELLQYEKLRNSIVEKGTIGDNQRAEVQKKISGAHLFIANKEKEIAEIRTKEYEKQEALRREHSKILQDEWVASQKLAGIEVKKSDILLLELQATSKLLEKEHDKYEIAKLNTKVADDVFSLNKTLAEEEGKRLDIQDKLFIAAQKRNGVALEESTIMAMELTRLYKRQEVEIDIYEKQLLQVEIDNKIYAITKQVGEEQDKARQREEKYLREKANLSAQLTVEQEKLNSLSVIYSSKQDNIVSSYVKQLADIEKQVAKINDLEILEEDKAKLLNQQKEIRDTILAQQTQELENASIFRQTMIETVDIMQDGFQNFFDFSKDGFLDLKNLAKGLGDDILGSFSKNISSGISTSLMGSIFGAQKAEADLKSMGLSLVGNVYKGTIGGQAVEVDKSGNILSGGGLSSVVSTAASLKSASSLLSGGLAGAIYAPSATMGGLAGSAYGAGYTGLGSFLGGSANALGGGSASALSGSAYAGALGTQLLVGGAVGYGVGSLGDKLFGADTKAGLGGAIGGAIGTAILPGVGTAIGSVLGSAIGGMFGSTKLKDQGIFAGTETSASMGIDELSRYEDYKKKSWFSSKSWTTFTDLTDSEKGKIEGIFESYDYLLAQLGNFDEITVAAGKYTGDIFQDEIAKSMLNEFIGVSDSTKDLMAKIGDSTDTMFIADALYEGIFGRSAGFAIGDEHYEYFVNKLNNLGVSGLIEDLILRGTTETLTEFGSKNEIYDIWVAYAKEIDKTTGEAITEALSGIVMTERGFTEWALSFSNKDIEALSFKAEYLSKDFANLAKMMDAENVTVDNYTESMKKALQENLTPENISLWEQLGNSIMASSDATKAYTDALIQEEQTKNDLAIQVALASANNISLFLDSLRTQKELAENLASLLGVNLATNVEELATLFAKLAYDAEGLNDAELELLNLNKALLENTESYQTEIDNLNTTLNDASKAIGTLDGALGTIQSTIEKLRAASRTSEQSLQIYYDAIAEAQRLSTTDLYDDFAKAVSKASTATSALFETSNFQTSRDMQFAQLVAANQFEALEDVTLTEIDYLKQIALNTSTQIDTMTNTSETSTSTINDSLLKLIELSMAERAIIEAYSTMLGRKPDEAGLKYWASDIESGNISTSNIGVSIGAAAVENQEISRADYITKLYTEGLNRTPTAEEVDYWANQSPTPTTELASLFAQLDPNFQSFAVGTPNVPYDMLANIHKGEIITPATYSNGIRNGDIMMGDTSGIVSVVEKLITRIEQLEQTNSQYLSRIEYNTTKSRNEGVA